MNSTPPAQGCICRSRFALVGLLLLFGVSGGLAAWHFGWFARGPDLLPLPEIDTGLLEERIGEAISIARERAREQPSNSTAWGRFGQVLHAHGFIEEARVCYENAEPPR